MRFKLIEAMEDDNALPKIENQDEEEKEVTELSKDIPEEQLNTLKQNVKAKVVDS